MTSDESVFQPSLVGIPGPSRIVFGRGGCVTVGDTVAEFGRKAMIVAGKSSISSGLLDRIKAQLDGLGLDYEVYGKVSQNPTKDIVDDGAAFASAADCDVVLALGGGSQMDAAKAMAFMAVNKGRTVDYGRGPGEDMSFKALPVVAVPTTCGTGSENNGICVLTDPDTRDKGGFTGKVLVPKASIVDPDLMETMPRRVMSAVSFDALSHLIESYVSSAADTGTDNACRTGLRLMSEGLVAANDNILDREALDKVVLASTLAGYTIFQAGTVVPHAMEHPLSGLKDIVHGRGLAAISPEIYERSVPGSPERFSEISRLFGGKDEKDIRTAIGSLISRIGVETTLSEEGFGHDDIPWLVESVERTGGSKLTRNPVRFTTSDFRAVYEACM